MEEVIGLTGEEADKPTSSSGEVSRVGVTTLGWSQPRPSPVVSRRMDGWVGGWMMGVDWRWWWWWWIEEPDHGGRDDQSACCKTGQGAVARPVLGTYIVAVLYVDCCVLGLLVCAGRFAALWCSVAEWHRTHSMAYDGTYCPQACEDSQSLQGATWPASCPGKALTRLGARGTHTGQAGQRQSASPPRLEVRPAPKSGLALPGVHDHPHARPHLHLQKSLFVLLFCIQTAKQRQPQYRAVPLLGDRQVRPPDLQRLVVAGSPVGNRLSRG